MTQKNILTSSGGQQILNESKVDSTLSIAIYSIKEFLTWWYIRMTLWHLRMLVRVATLVDDNMSISILLRNFFTPWHRDHTFIGYVFGILIKVMYLPVGIITYLIFCTFYLLLIFVWLLLPPASLFFILRSILTL
jgi:hypothetical protein